jgi:hypothetical protein
MKKIVLLAAILLTMLNPLCAQIGVEVTLNQEQFLPGEALPAAVRITNRSGQTLHLGADPDWLTFSVESADGTIVLKSGEVPVIGEFALGSSKVATKRVDIAPYFSLTQPGRYSVVATVRIRNWNDALSSPPKSFDVIEGAKLWEQEFGVPPASGASNTAPELRKYILQQANYLKHQLGLYLRLTDASGAKAFRVFPIGPMLSFSRPEAQVDKLSNLHVLYQYGPRAFSYTVFNPAGDLIVRQTHDYINTRPRLQADPDGNIVVFGGVRRLTTTDVPAIKSVASQDLSAAPPPQQEERKASTP